VWPNDVPLNNTQAANYDSKGFEVGMHPNPNCDDFTNATLAQMFSTMLAQFQQKFTSLPKPVTNRTHCLAWSNWLGEPTVELANGIRLDANYYYWPSKWIKNLPGFMNGAGMPMRFADTDGTLTDVYQSMTDMTDESGQTYPFTVDTLLNNAVGTQGYYGVFGANLHTDYDTEPENDAVLASAKSHGIPIVSGRQMLTWLDGRNASTYTNVAYSNGTLSFVVNPGAGSNGLTAMLPTAAADGLLSSITLNGNSVSYTKQTIKGLEYAMFPAAAGTYAARYGTAPAAPAISALTTTTTDAGTPAVSWSTNVPATTEVSWGEGTTSSLDKQTVIAEDARDHRLELKELKPGKTYSYRIRSRDQFGHTTDYPAADKPPATLRVPSKRTQGPGISGVGAMALPDGTVSVRWDTAEVADGRVQSGDSATALDNEDPEPGVGTSHQVNLSHLAPGRRYYYRVASRTPWGTGANSTTLSVDMPDYGVADSRLAQWQMGDASGVTITAAGDGEVRLSDGQSSGTYVSRVMDIHQMVDWKRSLWDADTPAGARLAVEVRTGSTSTPDASWTPWTDARGSGAPLPDAVKPSRYLQYRLTLTSGSSGSTPVVRAIGFTSTGVDPRYPGEGGG
jgi:hypothetical protein